MMGGPIDARKSPTAVNNLARRTQFQLVREQRDLPRAHHLPRCRTPWSTRVSCSTGFVAMNPDRHAKNHYDYFKNLIQGDDSSRGPPQVLRRVQRRARHGCSTSLSQKTIETVFQDL